MPYSVISEFAASLSGNVPHIAALAMHVRVFAILAFFAALAAADGERMRA
jgi:hypothetical protein